jgi:hypothetical protein
MRNALHLILSLAAVTCSGNDARSEMFVDAGGLMRLEVNRATSSAAGYELWNFAAEPIDLQTEISSIDAASGDYGFTASALRQVHPSGESTVFTDLNAFFPPGEDATADSQFAFRRSNLLVVSQQESNSLLEAAFTGFEPIRQTGITTKFAHVVVPSGGNGRFSGAFAVRPIDGGTPQLAVFDNVRFGATSLVGDYNGNGSIDAADYVAWRNVVGQSGQGLAADGNANGQVDSGDYDIWSAGFGRSALSTAFSAMAVPEPASCALGVSALAVIAARFCWLRSVARRERPAGRQYSAT